MCVYINMYIPLLLNKVGGSEVWEKCPPAHYIVRIASDVCNASFRLSSIYLHTSRFLR